MLDRASCFLLKYKISEQQINPKMLSVASSCKWKFQKWQKSFIDKCPPLGSYPNKSLPPGQKLGWKSPMVGANFWCKPLGVRGGMVMDEIDTCITCFILALIFVNFVSRKLLYINNEIVNSFSVQKYKF